MNDSTEKTKDNGKSAPKEEKKYAVGSRIQTSQEDSITIDAQHKLLMNAQRTLGLELQRHEMEKRNCFAMISKAE